MISAGEFRKGTTFELDGNIYVVVDFQHVKPGKGSAFVRVTMKNIVTGQVLPRTFNPTDKVQKATVEFKEMQYLYNDAGLYYFMDMETYEQIPLNKEQVEDALPFIMENSMVKINFYKGNAFRVEPQMFVEFQIVECEPAVKGDTSKAAYKSAKIETGYTLQVPMFVNNGDRIRIDTRTGEYMERV